MKKAAFLLFALVLLFTSCERYHVVAALANENGAAVYVNDNLTGKLYLVHGDKFYEVVNP